MNNLQGLKEGNIYGNMKSQTNILGRESHSANFLTSEYNLRSSGTIIRESKFTDKK